MLRVHYGSVVAAMVAGVLAVSAQAQQQAPPAAAAPATAAPAMPPVATTKVAENVYIFRYVGHQSMFVVTPAGVIATDPISLRRPAKPYIDAIRAVTKAPIKYVIYSHSHFDHTAGGQAFKDLGATFIAQRNAKDRMVALKRPDIVIPDEVVDTKRSDKARRHDARTALCRQESFGQHAGHAAAEGEDHFHRRLDSG